MGKPASTLAFLWQYLRPRPGAVRRTEVGYDRAGEALPVTLYAPVRQDAALPGWVLLHGLTVSGREHASLDRFAAALAASGSVVFVPEIPEWKRLEPAPDSSLMTIRAAVRAIGERDDVDPDRVALIGFSFGATQAMMAAADPECTGRLRGIAAWGGYRDFHDLCRFGVTGEHDLDGQTYRVDPDPYGRWLMLANYLTGIPGHEKHEALAAAFRTLALEAGKSGVFAGDPVHDPLKARLRRTLSPAEREFFDLAAHPATQPFPDVDRGRELAVALADAALARDPLLDPRPFLPRVRVPTFLAHGRDDRIVPFTESLKTARELAPGYARHCTVTELFTHSGAAGQRFGTPAHVREVVRFVGLLRGILRMSAT
ncbi:MAG TPA: hypothetical protein VNZ57_06910 [Longimicrobiales bacterium]|nr:hypothetical protein [Longimicrobiales bacterium]